MPAPSPDPRRALVALALGFLAWTLADLLVERLPPGPGEGLALRWLRKLGEHPFRGSLALGCLFLALSRRPGARPDAMETTNR